MKEHGEGGGEEGSGGGRRVSGKVGGEEGVRGSEERGARNLPPQRRHERAERRLLDWQSGPNAHRRRRPRQSHGDGEEDDEVEVPAGEGEAYGEGDPKRQGGPGGECRSEPRLGRRPSGSRTRRSARLGSGEELGERRPGGRTLTGRSGRVRARQARGWRDAAVLQLDSGLHERGGPVGPVGTCEFGSLVST